MLKSLNNILFAVTGNMVKPVKTFLRTSLVVALIVLFSINAYAQPKSWDELNDQIDILFEEGDYSEVIVVSEKALKVANETYGADHPNTAKSMDALANVYNHLGKFKDAESLYCQALAIKEKTLGKDHQDVATSMNSLAQLHRIMGRYSDAEPLLKQVLEIMENEFGNDHLKIVPILENLAGCYWKMGEKDKAKKLEKRALQIRLRWTPTNSTQTLI